MLLSLFQTTWRYKAAKVTIFISKVTIFTYPDLNFR